MNTNNIDYSVAGYSVIESLATGLIAAVAAFFERVQRERERINQRVEAKRRAEKQIRGHTLDQLSLEEKVRLGIDRY